METWMIVLLVCIGFFIVIPAVIYIMHEVNLNKALDKGACYIDTKLDKGCSNTTTKKECDVQDGAHYDTMDECLQKMAVDKAASVAGK